MIRFSTITDIMYKWTVSRKFHLQYTVTPYSNYERLPTADTVECCYLRFVYVWSRVECNYIHYSRLFLVLQQSRRMLLHKSCLYNSRVEFWYLRVVCASSRVELCYLRVVCASSRIKYYYLRLVCASSHVEFCYLRVVCASSHVEFCYLRVVCASSLVEWWAFSTFATDIVALETLKFIHV